MDSQLPLVTGDTAKQKHKAGKCLWRGCRRDCVKYASGRRENICYRHKHERARRLNPIGYMFCNLRQNAKRRGKAFDLTLEEFRAFVIGSGYIEEHGRTAKALTIDRIDATQGYHIWNIQAITNSSNVRKQFGADKCCTAVEDDDLPF